MCNSKCVWRRRGAALNTDMKCMKKMQIAQVWLACVTCILCFIFLTYPVLCKNQSNYALNTHYATSWHVSKLAKFPYLTCRDSRQILHQCKPMFLWPWSFKNMSVCTKIMCNCKKEFWNSKFWNSPKLIVKRYVKGPGSLPPSSKYQLNKLFTETTEFCFLLIWPELSLG